MKHLLIISILTLYSFGCAWVNGTTIDGKWSDGQIYFPYYATPDDLLNSLNSTPRDRLDYFEERFSLEERNDNVTKGVFLMLDGNYTEAIEQFLMEEKREPNRYEVAANLGTAYELSGDNVNALVWIKEGMKRNPDSHQGTEWLHVRILETKLKLQEDKNYLKEHHIIDLETEFYNPYLLRKSLLYQLRERMLFVKPKDPIVADLLYTYAVANAEDNGFLEYSREALDFAKQYGYANTQQLLETQTKYQNIIDHAAFIENLKLFGYLFLFFLFLFVAYKQKWFFLTKKAQEAYIEEKKRQAANLPVKSKRVAFGRMLIPLSLVIATAAILYSNNLVFGIFSLLITLVFAFYFISNGREYEKRINTPDQDDTE